ncbi:MAG: DUF1934 domain-containing protein [Eubacteriales bacterium]|nr:DUF1934 domain-containing protein [Eubacteriales bacterium]MDD3350101.1 DUF1934 domain-containing protein [Eubacteriales bacterium]
MKDIMLKIVGKQLYSPAEEEKVEFVTEGKYVEENDGSISLLYDESEFSGVEGCTTSLKINGEKVLMQRHGEQVPLDAEIEFEKGKRFTGYYNTPYGTIEMEVLTNHVINKINRDKGNGSLNIDYHISLRGVAESRSLLDIEIMEKNADGSGYVGQAKEEVVK